jgi:hypothetical protein
VLAFTDFKLEQLQLTAFAKNDDIVPARLLRWTLAEFPDDYDAVPVSFPESLQLPPGAPAVILSGLDDRWRIEGEKSRVNLYRVQLSHEDLKIGEVAKELERRLLAYLSREEVQIGRLAVVSTRVHETENPAREIAQHFFKDRWLEGPVSRPETVEIHSHKIFNLSDGLPVNSWLRVRTAARIDSGKPLIAIEQDLNTLELERHKRSFEHDDISTFVDHSIESLEDILMQYFPSA